jgi:hypothetical protein
VNHKHNSQLSYALGRFFTARVYIIEGIQARILVFTDPSVILKQPIHPRCFLVEHQWQQYINPERFTFLRFIARGDLSGAGWSMHIIDTGAILLLFYIELTTTITSLGCLGKFRFIEAILRLLCTTAQMRTAFRRAVFNRLFHKPPKRCTPRSCAPLHNMCAICNSVCSLVVYSFCRHV